jgi:hypothetical protein
MPTVSKSGSLSILKPSGPVQRLLYLYLTKKCGYITLQSHNTTSSATRNVANSSISTALHVANSSISTAQHFTFDSFSLQTRAICVIFPLFLYVKSGIRSTLQATIVSFQILCNPLITNHVTIRRHIVELLMTYPDQTRPIRQASNQEKKKIHYIITSTSNNT